MALGNNPFGLSEQAIPIGGTTPPTGGVNLVFSTLANAPLFWNGAAWVPMWTAFQTASRYATVSPGFSSLQLLSTDQIVRVTNNSGGGISIVPPVSPSVGSITIKDANGLAGSQNFIFAGVIDGVVNPTLVDTNYAWAVINWDGASWARVG